MTIQTSTERIDQLTKLGRYVVLKLLGAGGMGRVYLAEDPVLQRKLAIKVITVNNLLDEAKRTEYINRFLLEARASARLSHHSIVTVYDVGQDGGMPWIAFEYVEGERLSDLIQRVTRLHISQAIIYALDIASALDHAHRHHIIHRDIKPSNILIDKHTGISKIADFGIVKAPWTEHTREGMTFGSPGYMSPEQIHGQELDGRSDIFSLGVCLYEMISGKHPFIRDTIAATAYATINGSFTPIGNLFKNTPREIDAFITWCLAVEKEKRIASAHDFIRQLQSVGKAITSQTGISVAHSSLSAHTATPGQLVHYLKQSLVYSSVLLFHFLKKGYALFYDGAVVLYARLFKRKAIPGTVSSSRSREIYYFFKTLGSVIRVGTRHLVSFIRTAAGFSYRSFITLRQSYRKKPKLYIITAISLMSLLMIISISSLVFRTILLNKNVAPASSSIPADAAKELDKLGLSWAHKNLIDSCSYLLGQDNFDGATLIAQQLVDLKAAAAYGHIFLGRIALLTERYEEAQEAFKSSKKQHNGKVILKDELDMVLDDAREQLLKDKAPESLITLIAVTLAAANRPAIKEWTTDKHYWLRWNAVNIRKATGRHVDMVNVYILDLQTGGSVRTRVNAAKKLGQLRDKRAIPALKEARDKGFRDPFTSGVATKVLEDTFNK